MSTDSKIVFLDTITAPIRKALADNVPPGFALTFAYADTTEKAAAAVVDADFVLLWATYMPTKVVESTTKAKLIQKIGEGTDRIDVATATRMGIPVAKTTGSSSTSVAEFAALLILSTLRRLPQAHNSIMAGKWAKWEIRRGSYEVRGKQVAIVGLGKIGKIVASYMRCFGASVVYYDLFRLPEDEETKLGVKYLPLDELLSTSDVISLHVPLTPVTRGMIGRRELALLKPTAILINTCRASVVDEEALYEVLAENKIRGAGIDVFASEPISANHLFLSLANVVLSPHCAGGTEDSVLEGIKHAYNNIVKVSQGLPLDPADLASA